MLLCKSSIKSSSKKSHVILHDFCFYYFNTVIFISLILNSFLKKEELLIIRLFYRFFIPQKRGMNILPEKCEYFLPENVNYYLVFLCDQFHIKPQHHPESDQPFNTEVPFTSFHFAYGCFIFIQQFA